MRVKRTKKWGGENLISFFYKKTFSIIIILTDLGSKSQVFFNRKMQQKKRDQNYPLSLPPTRRPQGAES